MCVDVVTAEAECLQFVLNQAGGDMKLPCKSIQREAAVRGLNVISVFDALFVQSMKKSPDFLPTIPTSPTILLILTESCLIRQIVKLIQQLTHLLADGAVHDH